MSDPATSSVGSATSPKLEPPPSPHANRKKNRRKKSTGITKPDGLSAGNEGTTLALFYDFDMTKTSEIIKKNNPPKWWGGDLLLTSFHFVLTSGPLTRLKTAGAGNMFVDQWGDSNVSQINT